jgi:hypothetical protein
MGPGTGLDGCGNFTFYRDLIPGRCGPRLAIPPAPSGPTRRDGGCADAVRYRIDIATLNVSVSAETSEIKLIYCGKSSPKLKKKIIT